MARHALQQYVNNNARLTERVIGYGSYGTVVEVELDGLICAGKKLHEVLLEGGPGIIQRFLEECALLSNLRHPNIVQFLGICFDRESNIPILLMERMMYNLDEILESNPDIPLDIKCSILHDSALGVRHLHGRSPPIIHRDLTAKNILLTSDMTAKISDLGVARLLPAPRAATMTQVIK